LTIVSHELGIRLNRDRWINQYQTIHNGVDCNRFQPDGPGGGWRMRLGVPPSAFVIGHVGRFDANKRQSDLVDAFRLVRRRHPSSILWLIGQGGLWDEVRQYAHDEPGVFFIPRVHNMEELLREIDAFVLCSLHEGLPRALLEAMATARAVVATDVGGIAEILDSPDGPCGLRVPPSAPTALADALLVLADSEYRTRLGANARRRVETRFSADISFAGYEALYSQVLGDEEHVFGGRVGPATARSSSTRH
jgi:glycosyltransferase involved in cell wall biosynthesis